MARPPKNNCDYFPHDASMRNHKKIKAIRSKFGIIGYGIWSMLLEHLTGNDGNVFEYSEMEFELMAGDFGVSATEIRDTVDYCIRLELLFNVNGFVKSESLDERLAPVYIKRGVAKDLSAKQRRENGKFATVIPESTVVSVTEMPQSKVKEIKVKKSKEPTAVPFLGEVLKTWLEWEKFRKEKKQKITPTTVKKQIQFLGGRGDPEIIAILNRSMTNGWTGLFELPNTNHNGNRNGFKASIRSADAVIDQGKEFGEL